ncbi:hypothetical protein EBU58_01675, partial [bacterium]|nr:hypothetical protein [bacterium]
MSVRRAGWWFVVCVVAGCVVGRHGYAADDELAQYALFLATAPRPEACESAATLLPLQLEQGDRICLIGNTLLERAQLYGHLPAVMQAGFPTHELTIRTLAWSADEVGLMPRPENFADLEQHLFSAKADVILAAYGFNESFAGEAGLASFEQRLKAFLRGLQTRAFNGESAARIVLLSPIPNENVAGVAAADRNNAAIALYTEAMRNQGPRILDMWKQQMILRADTVMDAWEREAELGAFPDFSRIQWEGAFPKDSRFGNLCTKALELNDGATLQENLYDAALAYAPPVEDEGNAGLFFTLHDPLARVQPEDPSQVTEDFIMDDERRAYAFGYIADRIAKWKEKVEGLQWSVVAKCADEMPL